MAKALKIMTFNVQQLPWLARKINELPIVGSAGGSPEPDPKGRARAVVRAILDMPLHEQPDIITFNEAFSETARPILISRLRSKYPHIIEKLEHSGADLEEDSGFIFPALIKNFLSIHLRLKQFKITLDHSMTISG